MSRLSGVYMLHTLLVDTRFLVHLVTNVTQFFTCSDFIRTLQPYVMTQVIDRICEISIVLYWIAALQLNTSDCYASRRQDLLESERLEFLPTSRWTPVPVKCKAGSALE